MVIKDRTHALATQRLELRPLTELDAGFLLDLYADPEVIRYTGESRFRDEQEAQSFLARCNAAPPSYPPVYLLRTVGDEKKIGWCGLRYDVVDQVFDLGFRLHRTAWGKGFATEASRAVIEEAFGAYGLIRVRARCVRDNLGGSNVLVKLGFKPGRSFSAHGYLCDEYELQRHERTIGKN